MVTLAFAQMAYFIFHDTPLGGGSDGKPASTTNLGVHLRLGGNGAGFRAMGRQNLDTRVVDFSPLIPLPCCACT